MSRKSTVLIVDGEQSIRLTSRIILQRAGYNVLTAVGAMAARTVLDTFASIDLIISDVAMPGTSGPELVMQIRPHYPNLKVLFITGDPDLDPLLSDHVRDWGCHVLRKPFLPAELVSAVTNLLQAPTQRASASLRAPRDECVFRLASYGFDHSQDQPMLYELYSIRSRIDNAREAAQKQWRELQNSWARFIDLSSRAEQINSASGLEGLRALRNS